MVHFINEKETTGDLGIGMTKVPFILLIAGAGTGRICLEPQQKIPETEENRSTRQMRQKKGQCRKKNREIEENEKEPVKEGEKDTVHEIKGTV